MRKLFSIIVFLVISIRFSLCFAQLPPTGDYLLLINDVDNKDTDQKMPVRVRKDGILLILLANGDMMPLAKMTDQQPKVNLEFMPLFEEFSGDFALEYLPQENFQLTNKKVEFLFFPFIKEEVTANNKATEIAGKWIMKNEKETLVLDFKLPYTLHITQKEEYESTSGEVFWVSQINGEDITVTNALFFNKMAGTLKQVQVTNNVLHFYYKGKAYVLQRAS